MPVQYHSAVIFVKDIDRSKSFYLDILEQTIHLDFGKNVILECGVSLWEIQPGHMIPQTLGQERIANSGCHRFELCFETENLDDTHARLKEAGVAFMHAIHEEPWGQRTIRFYDPDGHLIEIGETLKTFTLRLYRQYQTPEAVSKKTGIPLPAVQEMIHPS